MFEYGIVRYWTYEYEYCHRCYLYLDVLRVATVRFSGLLMFVWRLSRFDTRYGRTVAISRVKERERARDRERESDRLIDR